jgi:hypothetical protein
MRRRINTPALQIEAPQELIDYKQASLNVLLSKLPDVSTFAQIGELIGCSYEWVRQRLGQSPERLYKPGKRYRVPRGVAEDFLRSVLA